MSKITNYPYGNFYIRTLRLEVKINDVVNERKKGTSVIN